VIIILLDIASLANCDVRLPIGTQGFSLNFLANFELQVSRGSWYPLERTLVGKGAGWAVTGSDIIDWNLEVSTYVGQKGRSPGLSYVSGSAAGMITKTI